MGAIGALALVMSATACSSDSESDSNAATTDTLPEPAVEATTGNTDAPTTDAPTTEAPATDGSDGTAAPATEPPATDPAVVVPEALQFSAPLVGGGTFDGAAAAGKPTVFWFWAPT
jgi:hypothetical protein